MKVIISNYTEDNVRNLTSFSLDNQLSLVNFDDCLYYLRQIGVVGKNETVIFKKTDWDSKLNMNHSNTNISSVTFSLFSSNGTKYDMNLCNANKTSVEIYVGDNVLFNKSSNSPFDPNSPFYNDRCMPLQENDTEYSINERRKKFPGYEIVCSTGCKYEGINSTTFYAICSCSTVEDSIISVDFSAVLLKAITSSNFFIIYCYYNFKPDFVSYF